MNRERRARLAEATALIRQGIEILIEVETEEREAFYAMEAAGLGGTVRALKLYENADAIFEVGMELEENLSSLADL